MVAPFMPDAEKVAAVRQGLPAVAAGIYLNTPVVGPLPAETARAMADIAAWELTTGRAHRDRQDEVGVRIDEARAGLAAIVGADVDRVAITHGLADGLRRALGLVGWRSGDSIVIVGDPNVDPIVALPSATGAQGARLIGPRDANNDDLLLAAVDEALESGSRVLACPHVTGLGRRLPVERLAALTHERDARLVVDGSLAAGGIPVSIDDLGADAYVVPAWAWLLGPEGIGGLAVTQGLRGVLAADADPGPGEFHVPSVVGLARSCGWLSMYVGLGWMHDRGLELARIAHERLAAVPGVQLLTAADHLTTTIAFRIAGWSSDAALDELGARVFALASVVPGADALRIGTGFFNTEDELDRFASAVELLATHTPASLPPRRQLTVIGGDR